MPKRPSPLPHIGFREWFAFPELGIPAVKAKIDTGARSSALHTEDYEIFDGENGVQRVRFHFHPLRARSRVRLLCECDISDLREVKDSGGHVELRPFIKTTVELGEYRWPIEVSLTNREAMRFRMLLGRTAMKNRFAVDPGRSYLAGPVLASVYQ